MKNIKIFIILVFLIIPISSTAADKWSNQDIALETTWQMLHLIDWGTTLDIAGHPDRYELNPILGEHPDRGTIHAYMAAGALLHLAVTHLLPSEYRPWFQGITIGISGICVGKNLSAGLALRF
jgi:hypothetical protein